MVCATLFASKYKLPLANHDGRKMIETDRYTVLYTVYNFLSHNIQTVADNVTFHKPLAPPAHCLLELHGLYLELNLPPNEKAYCCRCALTSGTVRYTLYIKVSQ